jgi:hypothetical protein
MAKLVVPPDAINGLLLQWDSATVVRCLTGSAFIPSLNGLLQVTADITKTVTPLTANTKYYVYLYYTGTVADIELSTQAPATNAYFGHARTKGPDATPDLTRRYIGMILGNAAATGMYKFRNTGDGWVWYMEDISNTPFQVLTSGLQGVDTPVSCAAVVPPPCRMVDVEVMDWQGTYWHLGTPDDNVAPAPDGWEVGGGVSMLLHYSGAQAAEPYRIPIDPNNQFTYMHKASSAPTGTAGMYVWVRGYQEVR